jgi:hypothetical protein
MPRAIGGADELRRTAALRIGNRSGLLSRDLKSKINSRVSGSSKGQDLRRHLGDQDPVQKNNFKANWKFRGPPVLKMGLNPAPLAELAPSPAFAMLVVAPNVVALTVPPIAPKLG